jgi:hypothetical protein
MSLYLVNRSQSADERRDKYMLLRDLGLSYSHAKRMRDWRWSKIRIAVVVELEVGDCFGSKREYLEAKAQEEAVYAES